MAYAASWLLSFMDKRAVFLLILSFGIVKQVAKLSGVILLQVLEDSKRKLQVNLKFMKTLKKIWKKKNWNKWKKPQKGI